MEAQASAHDQRSWSSRAHELEDTTGEFWQPNEGDAIGGRLTDIERDTGKKGDSTIYTIEDENGNAISFWGSAVIDKGLRKAEVGDVVLLKYLGRKKNQAGNEYKNFAIKREKAFPDDVPY